MKLIPTSVTRAAGRHILKAKKHSPHVFFGVGVVGTVTSTVLACRATLRLERHLDDFKYEVAEIKEMKEATANSISTGYDETNYRKDVTYIYIKNTAKIVRLYGPAAVVGITSIGLLTGSHITLTKRNTALTAAYAAVSKAYDNYRDRVREEVGEERELDLYHSAISEKSKDENGKAVTLKTADPNSWSPYARFFDEASPEWKKNAELNHLFVQCQQNYANHLLHARGHVFLNEVYDMLGIDRSQAGQVVGWVISKEGDNYIDFGIYQARNSDFISGWERSILLDFNVDGVIYDKI